MLFRLNLGHVDTVTVWIRFLQMYCRLPRTKLCLGVFHNYSTLAVIMSTYISYNHPNIARELWTVTMWHGDLVLGRWSYYIVFNLWWHSVSVLILLAWVSSKLENLRSVSLHSIFSVICYVLVISLRILWCPGDFLVNNVLYPGDFWVPNVLCPGD